MDRRQFLKGGSACAPLWALPALTFSPPAWAAASEFPAAPDHNVDKHLKVRASISGDNVALQVEGADLGDNPYVLSDTSLRLRLLADRPDGTQVELGVVTHPYALTVRRSMLPAGGWVSLTGEVLAGTPHHRFRIRTLYLGSGTSKVPLTATRLLSAQYDSGRADWLDPVERLSHGTAAPYALRAIASQNGVAPVRWVKEAPWGNGIMYPESFPRWRRIGGVVQSQATRAGAGTADLAAATTFNRNFPAYGGPPGVANTVPYATLRGHPSGGRGPQWIEMDGEGRFWGYNRDGSIVTMAGYRMPADGYEIADETLSGFHAIGSFPNGAPRAAHDFAYDFVDRKLVYVADTGNDRLLRIDRHAAVVPGRNEDFSKWVFSAWGAAFSHPTSIESTADGRLYVVDHAGLWSVDRSSGSKTSLWQQANLFWVRSLSNGMVCVADTTGKIFRFDPSTRQSSVLADIAIAAEWPVISVDTGGHIGPRDSLYYVTAGAYSLWRIDQDGRTHGPIYIANNSGYVAVGDARYCADAPGHYLWNAEVHPEEPYLLTRGFANAAPVLFRPQQADEEHLSQYEHYTAAMGYQIMLRGTVPGFPWGSRPSFTSLRAVHGHTGLGLKMFDEIQALALQDRIAYVRAGMGGSVARPELVGDALRAVLYWIWRNSKQFIDGRPADIPPPQTDATAPAISNVRVSRSGNRLTWSWRTDRPALCYVRFAQRTPLYRWTALESGFSTEHTAVAAHVDQGVSYQICALGSNGVLTEGAVATVGAASDTVPPKPPTGLS